MTDRQWKSIESAPKNGARVWVKFANGEVLQTYWLVPNPVTAGWFPWYMTKDWHATHWAHSRPESNEDHPHG